VPRAEPGAEAGERARLGNVRAAPARHGIDTRVTHVTGTCGEAPGVGAGMTRLRPLAAALLAGVLLAACSTDGGDDAAESADVAEEASGEGGVGTGAVD
jgi:hypothetical protein